MKIKKIIFILFLTASVIGGLVSCGTRKVEAVKTKETTKSETEVLVVDKTEINTNIETNTKTIDCTYTNEIVIEPIDNSKPLVINGKTYINARISNKKTKNNIVVDKVNKIEQKQNNDVLVSAKAKVQTSKVNKAKSVVSNKGNFWNWVILFVVGCIIFWFILWSRKLVKDKEALDL